MEGGHGAAPGTVAGPILGSELIAMRGSNEVGNRGGNMVPS
jgi:hypothetical protein